MKLVLVALVACGQDLRFVDAFAKEKAAAAPVNAFAFVSSNERVTAVTFESEHPLAADVGVWAVIDGDNEWPLAPIIPAVLQAPVLRLHPLRKTAPIDYALSVSAAELTFDPKLRGRDLDLNLVDPLAFLERPLRVSVTEGGRTSSLGDDKRVPRPIGDGRYTITLDSDYVSLSKQVDAPPQLERVTGQKAPTYIESDTRAFFVWDLEIPDATRCAAAVSAIRERFHGRVVGNISESGECKRLETAFTVEAVLAMLGDMASDQDNVNTAIYVSNSLQETPPFTAATFVLLGLNVAHFRVAAFTPIWEPGLFHTQGNFTYALDPELGDHFDDLLRRTFPWRALNQPQDDVSVAISADQLAGFAYGKLCAENGGEAAPTWQGARPGPLPEITLAMYRFTDFLAAERWDEASKPAEVTVEGCTQFCERENWLEKGCQ